VLDRAEIALYKNRARRSRLLAAIKLFKDKIRTGEPWPVNCEAGRYPDSEERPMIQLLDSDVDLLEAFLRRLVTNVVIRQEIRDTALSMLRRLELARKGYPDYRKPMEGKAEERAEGMEGEKG